VQNNRAPLEKRLAKLLAATAPLAARHTGHTKVDLVYLDEETQDRLNSSLHE